MASSALTGGRSRLLTTVICFAVAYVITPVSTKCVQGTIDTDEDWKYITKYRYLPEGLFDYVFKYPVSYGVQQLLLYYDEPGQWESVYKSNKNCSERRSVLSSDQITDLTNRVTDAWSPVCSLYQQDGEDYYKCIKFLTFRSSRERWWYIVIARCEPSEGGEVGLKLDYKIRMMNGSVDEDDSVNRDLELSAGDFSCSGSSEDSSKLAYRWWSMAALTWIIAVHN